MKKKEFIFILSILLLALVMWGGMYLMHRGEYGTIRITVNGTEYGTYSLSEDQIISVNGTNVCEIKDGKVRMIEADCPDHLCLKQKSIGNAGGTIVCLPNKVVVEGEKTIDDTEPQFDTAV